MDVARPPRKKTGRNIAIAAGVVTVVAAGIALAQLKPAAPTVDYGSLLIDSVKQGDLIREVRGPGTLVPERIRWITAQASARVERLVVQSGQKVTPGMLLLEMKSPDLEIATMQADQQVREAEIALLTLKTNLQNQQLAQEGTVASTRTAFIRAQQQARAVDSLLPKRMITVQDATNQKAEAEELTTRYRIEQDKLKLINTTIDSQISVQSAQVKQLRALADNQRARLQSLNVIAPEEGVLQDLTLQVGQYVQDGATLAKVVQPGSLKAVLRIAESQAKDVQIGQIASIDTRNGLIAGTVSRKDPSAVGGSVTIDVALNGELPAGAVPDLSVDGTIQIDKMNNILYTGRPAAGSGTGPVGLFKLSEDGKEAVRTQVVLGRNSVNAVEIISGLKVGEKVIVSDMTASDQVDRVRIKK
ncbi:MAG: efflux RND transporter periplasmic adaptor subunit [Phycisphaerae bacterium]|nr:efflux RND transporter periplasmic adaptor subunit [Gemmatimonadaceae bacterium]